MTENMKSNRKKIKRKVPAVYSEKFIFEIGSAFDSLASFCHVELLLW